MKKRVILLGLMALLTALFMTVSASAAEVASGTCGENLTWVLDDAGKLTISGSGEMDDWWNKTSPWCDYCADIRTVSLPAGLTSVGDWAFGGCNALTTVNLPYGLETIGSRAFYDCARLAFPAIPGTVTSIGEYAFYNCDRLQSVVIPAGVTEIAACTFYDCGNLRSVIIPDSVTAIGYNAFYYCYSLASVTIPDSVTAIGDEAFSACRNLTSVTIPDSVTAIGVGAFSTCYSLTSVTIPGSVTSIGNNAFYYCHNLTRVELNEGLTSIGDWAFHYCNNLTDIQIPSTVTAIGEWAFSACNKLPSFTIPNGVTTVSERLLGNGRAITYIGIPNSVTSIEAEAFDDCSSLTSITIPASVTYLGDEAFYNCTALADIYFCGTKAQWKELVPDDIASKIFTNYSNITVHYNYAAPVITSHPGSVTTTPDGSAKFTVKTKDTGCTYQWQYSTDSGATWKNNSGTKATFSLSSVGESRNGYQYRCKVTQNGVSTFSAPATLTVVPAIVTAQPESVIAPAKGTATFSVAAKGSNLKYQWQYSTDGGLNWYNNTCTAATLTIDKPGAYRDGYAYRCKITNSSGSVFSNPAVLSVTGAQAAVTKPSIASQPKSVSVAADGTAKFTVTAEGGSLKYQWQYKAPGKAWANNTCTAATFTINGPQAWRDGYQYRCKVSNSAGTVISKAVVLTITAAEEELKITSQPVDAEVKATDKVSFSVTATGTGLTYQWQYKAPGKGWVNNSCTKATLTFDPAKLMRDGYRYRCVITDVDGNILVSAIALLTVN